MEEQKKIYVIESGMYSDYTVHAAYHLEADAESACKRLNALFRCVDKFSVLELALEPQIPAIGSGKSLWDVELLDGLWSAKKQQTIYSCHLFATVSNEGSGHRVTVIARTKKQALKAGMERIREYRALEGVTHGSQMDEERRALQAQEQLLAKLKAREAEDEKRRKAEAKVFDKFNRDVQADLDALARESPADARVVLDKHKAIRAENLQKIRGGSDPT